MYFFWLMIILSFILMQSENDHSSSGVPLTELYFDIKSLLLVSGDQSGMVRLIQQWMDENWYSLFCKFSAPMLIEYYAWYEHDLQVRIFRFKPEPYASNSFMSLTGILGFGFRPVNVSRSYWSWLSVLKSKIKVI